MKQTSSCSEIALFNKYTILTLITFCACSSLLQRQAAQHYKKIQFEEFAVDVPEKWQKISLQGIDSFVGGISDGEDTLSYDFSTHSTQFKEDVRIYPMKEKSLRPHKRDGATVLFSNTPEEDYKTGKHHKYQVDRDTLNGYLTEITYPKHDTIGHYEIFVHSIYNQYDLKFYGTDILPSKRKEILDILGSLSLSL